MSRVRPLVFVGIAALGLSGAAYLVAVLVPPPGWRFLGGIASPDDASVYLAAMYQGVRGAWLYRPPFDPTLVPPLLMYTLYLGLGHLARLLQIDLALMFHLARLASGACLLFVAAWWARRLFETAAERRTAWLLVAFSSGLGWLLALIPVAAWQARLIDLRLPEASSFLAIFTAPHFALGVALEALALLAFAITVESRRWWAWAIACGLILLGLGLVYPFALPVVYATIGAYVLWQLWIKRTQWMRILCTALIAGIVPLPFVLYYTNTFFFDPFWRGTHVAQNVIPTPGPGWLVAGYGLPLLLALWGGIDAVRSRDEKWALLALWALINAALLWAPVPFQWRLANGWHFALALLAARGLVRGVLPWMTQGDRFVWLRRSSSNPSATLRRVILILSVPSTLMVVLIGVRIALTERGFPYYFPDAELTAMDDLSGQLTFDDVVLGAYQTGNVLPAHALCRVVAGQQFTTLDPQAKLTDVARFFRAETPDEQRRTILEQYGVTVVYYGIWERTLGGFAPGQFDGLIELARSGDTVLYRVQAPD
ncbi:MAG: hypothetical protein JW934_24435 [Anaerolineae bacterium]|nr:hypothetical protein [Anaerolineae bacterium]